MFAYFYVFPFSALLASLCMLDYVLFMCKSLLENQYATSSMLL